MNTFQTSFTSVWKIYCMRIKILRYWMWIWYWMQILYIYKKIFWSVVLTTFWTAAAFFSTKKNDAIFFLFQLNFDQFMYYSYILACTFVIIAEDRPGGYVLDISKLTAEKCCGTLWHQRAFRDYNQGVHVLKYCHT